MPPSQLKQLKSSLRNSGVLGPQQSKKQKRQNAKTGASVQQRQQRNAALQAIRDRFNPFEIKAPAKRIKFDATTRNGSRSDVTRVRPGVTKSLGEEKRRATLLQEIKQRNKVGGIVDRRFGENDPTTTPEERAAERFARESQKRLRKESMFNLDDDEETFQLTHMGQSLALDNDGNANEDDFEGSDQQFDDDLSDPELSRKRKRAIDDDVENDEDMDKGEQLARKKSKNEVMKEVIAKSKFHKYERQKVKEADSDLREELDRELPDLFSMLRDSNPPPPKPGYAKDDQDLMSPERAALLEGKSREDAEKEYDQRLRQMTFDKRSAPTDRIKTVEEKAMEEAERLRELEEGRIRRMHDEELSEREEDKDEASEDESIPDDAKAFGLQQPGKQTAALLDMDVEDEDDFIIDDDLVEMKSDISFSADEAGRDDLISSAGESEESEEEDDDDEFTSGLSLLETISNNPLLVSGAAKGGQELAFTYPCPEDHKSFLDITKDVPIRDLPTVVQRIRALHSPRLHSDNKKKLGCFAAILVQHAAYIADQFECPDFTALESLLRHVHSLAKSHPGDVSQAYRARLREIAMERPINLSPGDLVILTGIATAFPTSDHFHAVVTPAHLCLARYLGQGSVDTLANLATGAYAASLCLQYQIASKRYMPEFMDYVLDALCNLCPTEPSETLGLFPLRKPKKSLRLLPLGVQRPRKLKFWDVRGPASGQDLEEEFKISLTMTFVNLLDRASDLWAGKPASFEIFESAYKVLVYLQKEMTSAATQSAINAVIEKLDQHNAQSLLTRRPLLLHSHRPLAIKTAIPKFEDGFKPDRHYDPNRDRAESNRLQKEYKRERKGAIRELRKDAQFIAREQLREKRERDAEYEKKYRKLVSEVQSEEGRAAKEYEREKRLRRGK